MQVGPPSPNGDAPHADCVGPQCLMGLCARRACYWVRKGPHMNLFGWRPYLRAPARFWLSGAARPPVSRRRFRPLLEGQAGVRAWASRGRLEGVAASVCGAWPQCSVAAMRAARRPVVLDLVATFVAWGALLAVGAGRLHRWSCAPLSRGVHRGPDSMHRGPRDSMAHVRAQACESSTRDLAASLASTRPFVVSAARS